MASEKRASGEAHESPDQSIKERKHQLFEDQKTDEGSVKAKAFAAYLKDVPPSPMNSGIKAALWAAAVLVALLFLASLFGGRSHGARGRQAASPGVPQWKTEKIEGKGGSLVVSSFETHHG